MRMLHLLGSATACTWKSHFGNRVGLTTGKVVFSLHVQNAPTCTHENSKMGLFPLMAFLASCCNGCPEKLQVQQCWPNIKSQLR